MARINLLPWREDLRRDRQTNFIIVLCIAMALTAATMFGVHLYYEDRISYQNKRNAFLEKEIKKLDMLIRQISTYEKEKKKLQAHLKIIQTLQSSRSEVVHLFDELVRTLPDGVYLNSFAQNGKNLTIRGIAQSNARVSSYMWGIEKSNWIGSPQLNIISSKKSGRRRTSDFTLKVTQINKKAIAAKEAAEKAKNKSAGRK